jgi:hypothetical protein
LLSSTGESTWSLIRAKNKEEKTMRRAFHGTDYYGDIKKFRKSKSGALGSGLIYFGLDEKCARYYAVKERGEGDVYEVNLLIDNPLVIPDDAEPVDFILSPAMAKKRKDANGNYCYWLKASDYKKYQKEGYDAVIYRNEIAVFDAEVVKIVGKTHVKD